MSQDDIFGLKTFTRAIPSGFTNAVLVTNESFESGSVFEQVSGGTVWITGVSMGQTLSAADLDAIFTGATNLFLMQSGRSINIDGAPRYYVAATGATAVVQWLRGTRAGY